MQSAFVTGMIIIWSGSSASIPSGWLLCNGASSTPDLRDRFVVGAGSTYAVNATGGSANAVVVSHTHTATVTDPSHAHNALTLANSIAGTTATAVRPDGNVFAGSIIQAAVTGITVSNSTEGVSGTNANLPPYYALCYIMKT
jgi:microcystin-dependent protein